MRRGNILTESVRTVCIFTKENSSIFFLLFTKANHHVVNMSEFVLTYCPNTIHAMPILLLVT